jgi:hypothetical protein
VNPEKKRVNEVCGAGFIGGQAGRIAACPLRLISCRSGIIL